MIVFIILIFGFVGFSNTANALSLNDIVDGHGGIPYFLIAPCIIISILTVAIKSTVSGGDQSISRIFMRLFFVIVGILAASFIQNGIIDMGISIQNSLFPDMDATELIQQMSEKATEMQKKSISETDDISLVKLFLNVFSVVTIEVFESMVVYIMFFILSTFEQIREMLNLFLQALGPYMIAASIIPGVNGFSNWMKFICNLSLWPIISSFFLQAHVASVSEILGDVANPLFKQNTLEMMGSAILFIILFLATPVIANTLISGSAGAFSMAATMLVSSGTRLAMGGKSSFVNTANPMLKKLFSSGVNNTVGASSAGAAAAGVAKGGFTTFSGIKGSTGSSGYTGNKDSKSKHGQNSYDKQGYSKSWNVGCEKSSSAQSYAMQANVKGNKGRMLDRKV